MLQIEKSLLDSKQRMEEKYSQMEKLVESKDEIIEELGKNNELKDQEIKKMEELIVTFKTLLDHMNEEKAI